MTFCNKKINFKNFAIEIFQTKFAYKQLLTNQHKQKIIEELINSNSSFCK